MLKSSCFFNWLVKLMLVADAGRLSNRPSFFSVQYGNAPAIAVATKRMERDFLRNIVFRKQLNRLIKRAETRCSALLLSLSAGKQDKVKITVCCYIVPALPFRSAPYHTGGIDPRYRRRTSPSHLSAQVGRHAGSSHQ